MSKMIKLNPFIIEKIWGGTKLKSYFPSQKLQNIGEVWGVSTLKEGSSSFDTMKLNDVCDLSYLVKIIDTSENLSIQVHPGDGEVENSRGKTEAWLILDAKEGAGVYLGFKPGVTKKEFETALKSGVSVNNFLRFHPVKKNDFLLVPAGVVHAIGEGVTLCEVQQSSGVTYRVWDWNRLGFDGKPRELHIDKALETMNFSQNFYETQVSSHFRNLDSVSGVSQVYTHHDFDMQYYSSDQSKKITLNLKNKESITVLEGEISGDVNLSCYESAIVFEAGAFELNLSSNTKFILVK